jgi:hypothetical protein
VRGLSLLACLVMVAAWPRPGRADEQRSEAARLFEQAQAHLTAGELDRAVELFESSFQLSGEPVLVYDMAQAYRLKGDCESALRQYRRYLQLTEAATPGSATDEPRRLALDHALTLERQCGQPVGARPQETPAVERAPAPAPPPSGAATRQKGGGRVSALPLVLASVGAAALTTGIYFLAVDGRERCTAGETAPCAFRRDTARLGWGFFAGGAAFLASGVTLAVLELRAPNAVAIGVGPTSLQIGGRF